MLCRSQLRDVVGCCLETFRLFLQFFFYVVASSLKLMYIKSPLMWCCNSWRQEIILFSLVVKYVLSYFRLILLLQLLLLLLFLLLLLLCVFCSVFFCFNANVICCLFYVAMLFNTAFTTTHGYCSFRFFLLRWIRKIPFSNRNRIQKKVTHCHFYKQHKIKEFTPCAGMSFVLMSCIINFLEIWISWH